jgi:hypothetical protein
MDKHNMKNERILKINPDQFLRSFILSLLFASMFVFAFVFTPVQHVSASPSVYYVSKTGKDSNPGTEAQPWLTVTKAANTMIAGDTVYVETGTYNERVFPAHSGSTGSPITYQNYNGQSVIINGTGLSYSGLFLFQGTSYINISGLTIENSLAAGDGNGIFLQGASNINITNCTITNTVAAGIAAYDFVGKHCSNIKVSNCTIYGTNTGSNLEAISCRTVQTFTISNCIVHDTGTQIGIGMGIGCTNGSVYGNSVYNTGAMGIYVDSEGAAESNISIYNNVCHNNAQAGIGLSSENTNGQYPQTGISIYNNICYSNVLGFSVGSVSVPSNTFSFTLINNTFYGNSYRAISLGTYSYIASGIIRNNIIVGTSNAILMAMSGSGANVTIDHNLFYSTGSYNSSNIYGTNYLKSNPLLTNPTSNFALQSASPAIGAGSVTGAPAIDYAGITRPNPPSVGAYEYIISPVAITDSASIITASGATPNGILTTLGSTNQSSVSFDWGIDTGYSGGNIAGNPSSITIVPTTFTANLTGLTAGTTYHYRAKAVGSTTVYGSDQQFTTLIPPLALAVTTFTLANGIVGVAYSQTLAATGGTAPYIWTIASGMLPLGLSFSSNGIVSGTPTRDTGPIFIIFRVIDSSNTIAIHALSISVAYCPLLNIPRVYLVRC